MKSTLIVNAQIVNEGTIQLADLLIKNGRIERIDTNLSSRPADMIIDAENNYILPGMIDAHVHFREPGLTHKGDIASESRAAVAGGITSYLEMPNTNPPTTTRDRIEAKCTLAARKSMANYGFYIGASLRNLEEIRRVDPLKVAGIKLFMGASTGNMLVDKNETLNAIFASSKIPVAVHCEESTIIKKNEISFRSRYGEDVPIQYHPKIRSSDACYQSTAKAVALAEQHGTRLHVLHLSTGKELGLFSNTPLNDKTVTAEACVHHLFFDDRDYEDHKTLIKCNPAIKSSKDRIALIDAIKSNHLDTIGTDHAPHTLAEKNNYYFKAPSGIPLAQHALVSLLERYRKGDFTLELIAEKTAHAPADIYSIDRRGYIREGYWADLVLIDVRQSWTVTTASLLSKCGWSPFRGYQFGTTILATIVSGQIAWRAGKMDNRVKGRRLHFNR